MIQKKRKKRVYGVTGVAGVPGDKYKLLLPPKSASLGVSTMVITHKFSFFILSVQTLFKTLSELKMARNIASQVCLLLQGLNRLNNYCSFTK